MKLIFDGETAQYHPATGLLLTPGVADYPDDKAEALIAAGLRKPSGEVVQEFVLDVAGDKATLTAGKRRAAREEKE